MRDFEGNVKGKVTLLVSGGVAREATREVTVRPSASLASTSSWIRSRSERSTSSFRANRDTNSS